MPLRPDRLDHRRQVCSEPIRIDRDRRTQRHSALAGAPEGIRPVRVAQLHPPRLGDSEGLLCPPRDRLPLGLSDEGHDPDSQVICLRHVHSDKANPAVPQSEKERRVAGEPVQLGDDQRCAGDLCQVQRLKEFRSVGLASALDLSEVPLDL